MTREQAALLRKARDSLRGQSSCAAPLVPRFHLWQGTRLLPGGGYPPHHRAYRSGSEEDNVDHGYKDWQDIQGLSDREEAEAIRLAQAREGHIILGILPAGLSGVRIGQVGKPSDAQEHQLSLRTLQRWVALRR
jgi:hypothetical protein